MDPNCDIIPFNGILHVLRNLVSIYGTYNTKYLFCRERDATLAKLFPGEPTTYVVPRIGKYRDKNC